MMSMRWVPLEYVIAPQAVREVLMSVYFVYWGLV